MENRNEISYYLNKKLNLDIYKINICKKGINHNINDCVYYHQNAQDKRRKLSKNNLYQCYLDNRKNKNINFARNKVELLYHFNFYKHKMCKNYFDNKNCELGKFCSYAHDLREIVKIPLYLLKFDLNFFIFYFKTEFCILGLIPHNKKKCVYAHNYQDFKRKSISKLVPIKCKYWNNTKEYYEYSDGCNKGYNCKFCHGWKEFNYHPLNYKTIKCKNINKCLEISVCSYYHNDSEKRVIKKNKFFEYVPDKYKINNKILKPYLN